MFMIYVYVVRSYLARQFHFRFDNGQGHAHIRSDEKLARDQWNTILVSRRGRSGLLSINNGPVKVKRTIGNLTRLNVDKVGYLGGFPPGARKV